MDKHTPLPWVKRQLGNDGSFFIESPKEQIGKPYGQEILADDYFDDLSKEADCDLIILACNNYSELVAGINAFLAAAAIEKKLSNGKVDLNDKAWSGLIEQLTQIAQRAVGKV